MSLPRVIYPALILCLFAIAPRAVAQKEIGETYDLSEQAKDAQADSIYFEAVKALMKNDETLAYQMFDRFSKVRPDVSDSWYELAKLSYNDKKIDQAEVFVKKAIALNPGNKWYQEEYATILAEAGDYEAAGKIMGDLSESNPDDPAYLLIAADDYERAKKYDKALEFLNKALVKNGMDEDIVMREVQVYLDMNEVGQAADIVKQLIAQDPKVGKYYKVLGDLYDNNKQPEKAAAVYEKAEQELPRDPYVQEGRAEHFLRVGDTASYIVYLKKAILNKDLDPDSQVDMFTDFVQSMSNDSVVRVEGLAVISQLENEHPADAQILTIYGDFLQMNNKPDSAVVAYTRALQVKSTIEIWRKLEDIFLAREESDPLVKSSEKFIRFYPNQVDPYYYNAWGHYLKKEYPAAIKAVNRAIDNQPDNNKEVLSGLYSLMGEIYHADKQDNLSDKAYDKALEMDPDNASVLNNYSYFLSERGTKLDEAEKMSKRSLELKPAEVTFLDTYGWILYKKGDYEKAKEYVKKAIDMSGKGADATLYDHLGNIYYKLNDKDKAVENWKTAKEKGVDDPQIDKKISEEKLYE